MAEEWMSRLQCRGSIARAAVVIALLSSRPADAQFGVDPGPPREPGGLLNNLVTGAHYDIVNQALAERHLQHLQAKLRRDAERGDNAAVDRDVCCIDNLEYRIAVDEWLIRWNLRQFPGYYPIRTDAVSRAAIAQAATPIQVAYPSRPVPTQAPVAAAATMPITIVNAELAGAGIAFAINGVAYQAAGGSRQNLAVAPDSTITYDGGGSVGQRRYLISPGRYEFRLTAEGWELYTLAGMP
jgi:hypothetical protein